MRKSLWVAAFLLFMGLAASEEGMASSRLLNIRKWSSPDSTRVVLDLDSPAAYEIQSSAQSPILTINLPKVVLSKGSLDVSVEDQVIHKVKLVGGEKEGVKVTFILYQPTRWKVFTLKPDSERPDRLVIDVFKPPIEAREEKAIAPPPKAPAVAAVVPEERSQTSKASLPREKEAAGTKEVTLQREAGLTKEAAPAPPPKVPFPPAVVPEERSRTLPFPVPREKEKPATEEPTPQKEAPAKEAAPLKGETPAKEMVPARVGRSARLLEIRQWAAPDHTRVVVDLSGPPTYEALPQTDPLLWALSLRGVALPKRAQETPGDDRVIRKMKVEPLGKDEARLTFFLVKPGQISVFLLQPYLDKPDRLVIDVSRPDLEEKEKVERQISRELKAKKRRIIVLDPGHGGEDPGAIGPRGTMEKDVVLALARNLQGVLDATGEVRAFLTRRGDYFVPLNERVKIAQEYGADLFISLHANGSKSRQTHGTSIYCLSLKGASDTATQLLAQKENASDMMGGISVAPTQRDLDSILLDLEQTHSINESLQLGGLTLSELERINPIQFSRPRQAGFAVLKAHEFPSILVETAYITHPNEESLLRKKTFQEKLCQAITAAVKKFIPRLAVKEGRPEGGGEEGTRSQRGS